MFNLCTGCPAHNYDNQLCSEYADPTYSCPISMVSNITWGVNGWELPDDTSRNERRKAHQLVEGWMDDSH